MLNFLIMFMLMMLSLTNFFLSLIFLINKDLILIDWLIYSFNSCNIKFIIFIDWMMLLFTSVVMLISSMVMLYSKEYMNNELKNKYFILILLMFVISMILMIISPNIISIILGWDGLGLISYCLIIYYQNFYSFNSGMLTLLSNRIGDIMLLMMIFMMMNLGSWNLFIYKFKNLIFMILLLIMIMTKSAQIPFSMWLPAAMAAPTPVSSLVHSSTLVTAGIYLLIRFNNLLIMNNMNIYIMFIGLMTMFIASINALFEYDFKKIIAFSTLSQLGLMMMMLSFKLTNYVFFHLISHAMFKSLLFLCSGMIIHFLNNMQDIRFMGSLIKDTPLIILYFNFSNLSLCGFPFLSGFYSKDLLYEMILLNKINLFIYMFMYFCIMLTIMYSMRLFYYLTFNYNMFNSFSMKFDNYLMNLSMFMLFILSIIFGNLINWLMFSSLNLIILNIKIKMIILILMILSIKLILMNYFIKFNNLINFLKKFFYMMNFFYLLKINLYLNENLIKFMNFYIKINEFSWNEFYIKYMMSFMINKMKLFMNNFFYYNLLNMFIFIVFIQMMIYMM
uniref:NADH:ubiquinone reductase (H(+)-translocating) n=1 Tax=Paramblynotus sp. ZJUH 20220012 TaxID=2943458 RepID=A0A9E8G7W2_9HYME|nr:NADH dehydrogenase subunit 5 [Paramblynotus sp. ZJUH 20220012]